MKDLFSKLHNLNKILDDLMVYEFVVKDIYVRDQYYRFSGRYFTEKFSEE